MKGILKLILFFVFLWSSIVVSALGDELPIVDTLAGQAFKARKYDAALVEFQKMAETNPEDPLILRYLAITLDRLGRHQEAIRVYQQALAFAPQNPALYFHMGTTYYKMGWTEKAEESFKKVLQIAPDSLYDRVARQYLDVIARQISQLQPPTPPHILGLYIQAGTQYDSNIPAAPEDKSLYTEERSGFRIFEYLYGAYHFLRKPNWMGSIDLSTYQAQYPESAFDRFKLATYSTGFSLQMSIALLKYEFLTVILDDNTYSRSHIVTAGTNIGLARWTTSHLYYRYTKDDFTDEGFDPAFSSRDADNHAVGISQVLYFANRKGQLRAGYEYLDNNAKGINFDMKGHKVSIGLGLPLVWNIQANLGADYSYEKYPDFQGPVIRKTNRRGGNAGLSKWLSRHILARIDYAFTDERSSYDVLTYRRWALGGGLSYVY